MVLLIMLLFALYLYKTENWIGLAGFISGFLAVTAYYAL